MRQHEEISLLSGFDKPRFYLRRPGHKKIALPGLPWSSEFMEAREAVLKGEEDKIDIGASRTVAGTVNAALVSYYQSSAFTKALADPWEYILANMPPSVNGWADSDGVQNTVQIIHRVDDGLFRREEVASADLLTHVLRVSTGQQDRRHSMKLAAIMKLLGWKRPDSQKVTIGGEQVRGYYRDV